MVCRLSFRILIRVYNPDYCKSSGKPNSPTLDKYILILLSSKQIVKLPFIFVCYMIFIVASYSCRWQIPVYAMPVGIYLSHLAARRRSAAL